MQSDLRSVFLLGAGHRTIESVLEEFKGYALRVVWIYRHPLNVFYFMHRQGWLDSLRKNPSRQELATIASYGSEATKPTANRFFMEQSRKLLFSMAR